MFFASTGSLNFVRGTKKAVSRERDLPLGRNAISQGCANNTNIRTFSYPSVSNTSHMQLVLARD